MSRMQPVAAVTRAETDNLQESKRDSSKHKATNLPRQNQQHTDSHVEWVTLAPQDAIMGRGAQATDHAGNKRLRLLCRLRYDEYVAATRHTDKQRIAEEIVGAFRSEGGRFVQQIFPLLGSSSSSNTDDTIDMNAWQIVDHRRVIVEKVKQILRDV